MTTFQNHHSARSIANSLLLTHGCRKRVNNVHADLNWYTELEDTVWRIQIPCCMKAIGETGSDRILGVIWSEFACEDVDDDRLGQIVILSKSSTVNDQLWAHTRTRSHCDKGEDENDFLRPQAFQAL